MHSTSQTIVFFGTEDFSAISLIALIEAGFSIGAVVTKQDTARGRGQKLAYSTVKEIALEHSIPVLQPRQLNEITPFIKDLDKPTGVLVSFGKIIPQTIIDLFTPGIINLHPSLLPKYRGPSPIETALLNGDEKTGVTIMQLEAKMDAGPIYASKEYVLHREGYPKTQEHLYQQLGEIGSRLLTAILPDIMAGTTKPTPQNEAQATYCQLIKKSDGAIDWRKPATYIERQIRAYHLWPKSHAKIGDIEVVIKSADVVQNSTSSPGKLIFTNNSLNIGTGKGELRIKSIQPVGKKEMPIEAFLTGYKTRIEN